MQLGDAGIGDDSRDHRLLERAGGDDDVLRLDGSVGVVARNPSPLRSSFGHRDPGADRQVPVPGEADEVIGHRFLRREDIGVKLGELGIGEAVMPGRAIGDQAVPAPAPPAFRDPVAFEDEVGNALLLQMGRGGNPRLPAADDKGMDGFGHAVGPPCEKVSTVDIF
jgi:hypothetical protein